MTGFALILVNRPALMSEGVCLHCDIKFVASPQTGGFGALPGLVTQELLAFIGLPWFFIVIFVGHTLLHYLLHELVNRP